MRFSYTGNFFLSIKQQTYPLGILIKTFKSILQIVTLSEVIHSESELQILADKTIILYYANRSLRFWWQLGSGVRFFCYICIILFECDENCFTI